MKTLKEVIQDCQLSFSEILEDYKTDYEQIFEREKDWLNNVEEKTFRLSENVRDDIEYVITKLKEDKYKFKESDTEKLSLFTSQINSIIRIANRINNFKEGTALDDGEVLKLFELFNNIKSTNQFVDFDFTLNKNLKSFIVHLFSVVKHCQSPDTYPIYYRYWKNILGEVLKKEDDYDSLCSFYQTIQSPKHLSLGTYFGTLGTILARNISDNQIIKEEDDKNYKYIRNKILNIHYFDIITGYKRKPNYYLIGSKYGENNDVDVFPKMLENKVVSVGFASHLDLSDFYLTDDAEIVEYLKEENEVRNSYNALKLFLNIKAGDKIAIKASGSPKGKKGFLSIVGIFEVAQNEEGEVYAYNPDDLGHTLNVKVINAPIYEEFNLGGYGSTVHKLSKPDHIDLIFKNNYPILDMNSMLKNHRKEFTSWLTNKYGENSGTTSSYIKAIDILTQILSKELFETTDDNYLESLYEDLIKEQRNQEGKYYHSDAPSYGSNGFYSASIKSYREFLKALNQIESIVKDDDMNFPLNTILYGPPGTGKTYNTILRAAQIIENHSIDSYDAALKIFKSNLHNRIEFITFHQNYSYEDFIQGLRPETDNKSSLVFDKKDGIFKKIADKALENIRLSEKAPEELSNEAEFNIALEKFRDVILENEDNYAINDTAYIFEVEEDAFRYTGEKWTNHSNGLRMKFSDLKEFYRNDVKSRKDIKKLTSISGLANQHATYYFLVYDQIIKYLPKRIESPQRVKKLNYVIIIDEINRANISRVFGELITLIEPDKRSNGAIPLEARLPSGDTFIVPSNLYIIGTMNTADKSIALLDIALRRRFEFESMYPQYEIDNQEIYDVDILKKINTQIIKSKGHDFQIGHAYFMGENKDLTVRMNKKVIPLLLEYYMNDEKEVKGILQSAGLKIEDNSWPLKISGKNG
jgi:5-methylcytosine-specific restriction endonuclease McrBC GTP-binding regulatory subunit McrB